MTAAVAQSPVALPTAYPGGRKKFIHGPRTLSRPSKVFAWAVPSLARAQLGWQWVS